MLLTKTTSYYKGLKGIRIQKKGEKEWKEKLYTSEIGNASFFSVF